jgi:protein ImuB
MIILKNIYAALWLPRFHLQAVLRGQVVPGPVAVLDSCLDVGSAREKEESRILHANVAAEAQGVVAGQTPAQAQARSARLMLLHRDAEAEVAAQRLLLDVALQCSPYYEATAMGLCTAELTRVRSADERREEIGNTIRQSLAEHHLDARIGFAHNPDLAYLAARAADPLLILHDDGQGFLQDLPLAALHPSPDLLRLLALWGLRRIGDLVALPRQDIASRLGKSGLLLWDLAAGGRDRLLRLLRPTTSYAGDFELDHAVTTVEPLIFVFKRLLTQLCQHLVNEWLVAAMMRVRLDYADGGLHERDLRIAEPSRDADLLLRLLHTHLDSLRVPSPIVKVHLELVPARPGALQDQLFERGLKDPNRFAETLSQIESLVGIGMVGKVQLLPSRRADAFALQPFLDKLPDQPVEPDLQRCGLPLRCYRPARPLHVQLREARPHTMQQAGQSWTITGCRGPWLMSGDWWDSQHWQREIWEVETTEGHLFQIAREGETWLLDGVFG